MKRFTNSITFDISYLMNTEQEKEKRNRHKENNFSNETIENPIKN